MTNERPLSDSAEKAVDGLRGVVDYVSALNQVLIEFTEVMDSTNTRIDRLERRLERVEVAAARRIARLEEHLS